MIIVKIVFEDEIKRFRFKSKEDIIFEDVCEKVKTQFQIDSDKLIFFSCEEDFPISFIQNQESLDELVNAKGKTFKMVVHTELLNPINDQIDNIIFSDNEEDKGKEDELQEDLCEKTEMNLMPLNKSEEKKEIQTEELEKLISNLLNDQEEKINLSSEECKISKEVIEEGIKLNENKEIHPFENEANDEINKSSENKKSSGSNALNPSGNSSSDKPLQSENDVLLDSTLKHDHFTPSQIVQDDLPNQKPNYSQNSQNSNSNSNSSSQQKKVNARIMNPQGNIFAFF
jgi:hypothetical protein